MACLVSPLPSGEVGEQRETGEGILHYPPHPAPPKRLRAKASQPSPPLCGGEGKGIVSRETFFILISHLLAVRRHGMLRQGRGLAPLQSPAHSLPRIHPLLP